MFSLNLLNSEIKIIFKQKGLLYSNPLISCVRDRDSTSVPERHNWSEKTFKLILIRASVIYQILWIQWILHMKVLLRWEKPHYVISFRCKFWTRSMFKPFISIPFWLCMITRSAGTPVYLGGVNFGPSQFDERLLSVKVWPHPNKFHEFWWTSFDGLSTLKTKADKYKRNKTVLLH